MMKTNEWNTSDMIMVIESKRPAPRPPEPNPESEQEPEYKQDINPPRRPLLKRPYRWAWADRLFIILGALLIGALLLHGCYSRARASAPAVNISFSDPVYRDGMLYVGLNVDGPVEWLEFALLMSEGLTLNGVEKLGDYDLAVQEDDWAIVRITLLNIHGNIPDDGQVITIAFDGADNTPGGEIHIQVRPVEYTIVGQGATRYYAELEDIYYAVQCCQVPTPPIPTPPAVPSDPVYRIMLPMVNNNQ